MFTGIVEGLARIVAIEESDHQKTFTISKPDHFTDLHIGDSIAVNGVCLTIVELSDSHFKIDAVGVTLSITTLGQYQVGEFVNLERALLATSRLGGHYVQGHIDTTAIITQIEKSDAFWKVSFRVNPEWQHYLLAKAYIAIDGMSLTLVETTQDQFSVMLIPHTRAVTRTQFYQVNQNVNIEIDILAKYAQQFLNKESHS